MADMMNIANPNNDYDGLNENSTDLERIDVFLKILLDGTNYLDYESLYVADNKEELFKAKLLATGFVSESISQSEVCKLTTQGQLALDEYGSYSAYSNAQIEEQNTKDLANEEKENLQMQKLRSDVIDITNKLSDYKKTQDRAKMSFYLSILAVILAALTILLKFIQSK
ncbi:hypothetical protein [Ferruginibacter sp.]